MAEDSVNYWEEPPAFLWQLLLSKHLLSWPNWPWHVRNWRLACKGWREAVDQHLPALCARPPRSTAAGVAVATLNRFRSLRLLHIERHHAFTGDIPAALSNGQHTTLLWLSMPVMHGLLPPLEHVKWLTGLPTFRFLDSGTTGPAMLHQNIGLPPIVHAVRHLPALETLHLRMVNTPASFDGLSTLTRLTALSLLGSPTSTLPLWPSIATLTNLRCLGLEAKDVTPRPAPSPTLAPSASRANVCLCLTALHQLSALELRGVESQVARSLPALVQGLPSLRRLAASAPELHGDWQPDALPIEACSGLEALTISVDILRLEQPSAAYAASFSSLQNLRSMELDFEETIAADDWELEALVANVCRHCTALQALCFRHDMHASVSEGVVARVSQLTGLTSLEIDGMADCGDVTIVRIAQKLHQLKRLSLRGIMEQDGALFRLTSLTALTALTLSKPHLMSNAELVKRMACLSQLRRLTVDVPSMNASTLAQLLGSLPDLELLSTSWDPGQEASPAEAAALLEQAGPRLRHSVVVDSGEAECDAAAVLRELGAL